MPEVVASVSRTYAAGDDLELQFTVVDSDGDAVNITGFTARFALSRRPGGTTLVGTGLSPATATASLTTPASGIYTITIDKSVTAALSGTYYFETEIEDGSADESTVSRGWMTFEPTTI